MRKNQKGFSLIELLIVVAIILIIAAIAIPNLIRSRMAANEASAVSSLRTLLTSMVTYSSTYGNAMPPSLNVLQAPAPGTPPTCDLSGLTDDVLAGKAAGGTPATFSKSGYNFTYNTFGAAINPPPPGCANGGFGTMNVTTIPQSVGGTGQRGFMIDQSGVIRFDATGIAPTAASPVLQ